jgi:hypothetical protein
MQTGFCTLQSTNRTGFLLMRCKQNNFQVTKNVEKENKNWLVP